jgi:plastocyanin
MNNRHSRRSGAAAVIAAVLLPFGSSVAALAPDSSAPPVASPSPPAATGSDPSVATIEYPVSGDPDDSDTGPGDTLPTLTVEAGDLWFAPSELTIPSDASATLVLVGAGQVAHNLIVDELGLQLYVGPGVSSEVTLSDLPPGTYQFYCSVFGHRRAGMYGTLTIE